MNEAEQNLIADLTEVSMELAEWAENLILGEGLTAQEVKTMLREAVAVSGRA